MADGKQWFKVWTSLLTDPSFDEIHNRSIGAWVRLGALVSQHGEGGKIVLPTAQLIRRLHLHSDDGTILKEIISDLAKINVNIINSCNGTHSVTFLKWHKYQVDNSYERVQKHRQNVTVQEEKRREKKKKRKEYKDSPFSFEDVWSKYPSKIGSKEARLHFNESIKTENDFKNINIALNNYIAHLKVEHWKRPMNGSTWFNNWTDWIINPSPSSLNYNENPLDDPNLIL